jgi:hypothetical protein
VLASQLSYDRGLGSFDAYGNYARLRDAEVDDVVLTLAGGVRLGTPALQVHAAVPLRLQYRELSGLAHATRFGAGDATLGFRAMVVEDAMGGIDLSDAGSLSPFFEPFIGARAPTGRAASDSETPTQADVMGDGAWSVFGGVAVSKFLTLAHALKLTGAYAHRFAHDVPGAAGADRRFAPGDEIDVNLAYLNLVDIYWSWTVFSSARWTLPAVSDDVRIENSDARRVRVGVGVSYYLTYPTWQLNTSVAADPPLSGLSKNVAFAGVTASLGLQRNFTY